MAAREAILKASMENEAVSNEGINKVNTVCMASGTNPKDWSFHGTEYQISHKSGSPGGNAFEPCLALVKDIIKKEDVHSPSGKY